MKKLLILITILFSYNFSKAKNAISYTLLNDTTKRAIDHINRAVADSAFKEADTKETQHRYKEALAYYNKAIENDHRFAQAYSGRGNVKAYLNDFAGSIEDYNQAISINPISFVDYSKRGQSKNLVGDYTGAIADYDKAIEIAPKFMAAYVNRGLVKETIKDYKGAMADYDMAIILAPNISKAYADKAMLQANLKDYKGALANYGKAILLDSKNSDYYYNRGNLKRGLKDIKGAIADYNKGLAISPAPIVYNAIGVLKAQLGLYSEAIMFWNKSLKLNPNDAEVNYDIGYAYFLSRNFKAAIASFNEAIRLKPDIAVFYLKRGSAKRDGGDTAGACKDWNKAVELGNATASEMLKDYCK